MVETERNTSRKGGAPEWHFADEDTTDKAPPATSNRNNFIFRAIVMLILMITAMYMFNFKETTYLSKKHKPSTWFAVKPHWQTTEELKLRMGPRKPSSSLVDEFGVNDDWMDNVGTDEWLERMDLAAQEELLEAEHDPGSVRYNDDMYYHYEEQ
mmetsp:Transcript_22123/g.61410  ORF Transcript_22123/g.61410 Transcript_22123/m.61410 type:complete len:154 (+) Transcript_22123:311-772(+)|eukprot:CAMPEP_0117677136 /NCGR_PEP_ID=MMETSP0804-20121206/16580_1 /TAXON_ID=1074897 /ORGANISM="Tetraselmis astigmatica, Strain CCMP880" /LENGTH=153 /DNA_ID=CAMNT_0005486391 /DNA_START=297 /DNA_END=758 /DNA_ORIENTATION=-